MGEYNELTKRLIAEGYTAEKHPEYVKVADGCTSPGNPLKNIYGGFEYQRIYCEAFVYQTGCGLFVQGKNVIDNICAYGKEYCHENNNPIVRCPFLKMGCEQNYDPVLGENMVQCWCECHRTDKEYDYRHSIEYERKKDNDERKRKYEAFKEARNGRICEQHMFYDERTGQWRFKYDPERCARICYHPEFCPVLGKKLSTKKGNVFYDLKKTFDNKKTNGEQFSLFDKDFSCEIVKGKRVFDRPCSIDICEAYVKTENGKILKKIEINNSWERFMNSTIKYEVLNVRAEAKETRDLWQDLEDIKAGITIMHESDLVADSKQKKRERAEKAKEAKKRKLLKQIEENGWNAFDSFEKKSAYKYLDEDDIQAAENRRKTKAEKKPETEQLTLFDLMGV